MLLPIQNAIPDSTHDVAARIAQQSLARRGADYADEVRRLLDAGLEVMRQGGASSRPRVADIVAAAGLSNEAFYRHFPSKDALMAAILEDGSLRLRSYLAHQMAKERTAERKVRRWVEGVLAQAADEEIADTTRAVLRNAGAVTEGPGTGQAGMNTTLAALLREPFTELGSPDPDLDAALAAHAAIGRLSALLHDGVRPTKKEVDHVTEFCLAAVRRP